VDVEVNPKAGRVYVVDAGAYNIETADPDAGLVWVVDARSNRLIRTFAIGISPTAAALSTDGRVLFIASSPGSLSRLTLSRRSGRQ
jgi:DNA-binding beta-propeller fold protein YncE